MIYCLCSRKTEETYRIILEHLRDHAQRLGFQLAPARIMLDFELAAMNIAREIFPDSEVIGCLFHLGQRIWAKAVEIGLKSIYDDRSHIHHLAVKRSINMILAIPFIPLDDVVDVFVSLRPLIHPLTLPVWKFFDEFYVRGKPAYGRRRAVPPRFPPDLWVVYQAVLNKWNRTNNYVEAYHSVFSKHMGTRHPNIWRFLQKVKKEQRTFHQQIIQIRGGHRRIRQPLNRHYAEQNRIIETIVGDYNEYVARGDIDVYLRAIACRLKRPEASL